jgi:hypothetical protein
VHTYIDQDGKTHAASDPFKLPLTGSAEELARDSQLKKAVDYLRQQLPSNN